MIEFFGNMWVPCVVFGLILLISGLIGFINGFWTVFYFLFWNMLGLSIAIFLKKIILNSLNSITFLQNIGNKGLLELPFLLIMLLFSNFIGLILYLIFRKKIKKSMNLNKQKGNSNVIHRIAGLGLGMIVALPISVVTVEISSVFVKEKNKINKLNDKMLNWITLFKYEAFSDQEKEDLKKIFDIIKL